jgi:hypothetical protein
MKTGRYILQPYKGMNTRQRCPGCQHRDKTFSVYIDAETGGQIHPEVGRCNREVNCGYHYTPKEFFEDTGSKGSFWSDTRARAKTETAPIVKPISMIPVEVFKGSLKGYNANNFVQYLTTLFGDEVASGLIGRYFIGSSKHWPGSTVFWQVDTRGKIRTGKIMLYNPDTGKRIKEPFNCITWVHKALKMADFELKQALFGEHLLTNPAKPVALVESEKTAVIASGYLPQFIWLAVGSLSNLSAERCEALKGRAVVLFPDLNGFEKWSAKAKELSHIAAFTVSNLLELKASEKERQQGLDLADYLIRFDYRSFSLQETVKSNHKELNLNNAEIAEVVAFWDQLDQEQVYSRQIF